MRDKITKVKEIGIKNLKWIMLLKSLMMALDLVIIITLLKMSNLKRGKHAL